ncbi:MAG TPA: alpha/beta fold hydrolase [Albitalea sp.]
MSMTRRTAMLGVALGSTGLLSGCAEGYFFYPDTRIYTTPAQLGLTVQEIVFGDELRLHGWWMPAAGTPRATLVQAHGNAANVTNHAPLVAWLPAAGINVLSFDYRGFGRSEGSPTLDGVVADTRAALAQARQLHAGPLPLVLLGQSLGGATSVRALAEETAGDVKLLILDSAFASYRGIARDAAGRGVMSWLLPLALPGLPSEGSDPLSAMPRIRVPVLLLHGEQDSIIPIAHSERLHEAAATNKQFIRIAGGQHLDALSRAGVRAQVLAAINAHI